MGSFITNNKIVVVEYKDGGVETNSYDNYFQLVCNFMRKLSFEKLGQLQYQVRLYKKTLK